MFLLVYVVYPTRTTFNILLAWKVELQKVLNLFWSFQVVEATPHPARRCLLWRSSPARPRSVRKPWIRKRTWRLQQVQYLLSLEYSVTVFPTYALSVIWIWALDKDDQYVRVLLDGHPVSVFTFCFFRLSRCLECLSVRPCHRYVLRYFPEEDSGSI